MSHKELAGGWSSVVAAFVKSVFGPDLNLETGGIGLTLHGGGNLHIFAKYGMTLGDSLSLDDAFEFKGTSGLKVCGLCANVYNTSAKEFRDLNTDWGVFHDCPKVEAFQLHSQSSITAVVTRLRDASAEMGVGAFDERVCVSA